MKILLFILLFGGFFSAQEIREYYTSYQDFDFQKQPKKITKIHYLFKDKVAIEQRKETYVFDDIGNITTITEVNFMDGNNEMKTVYEYQNGLLTKECSSFTDKNSIQHCTMYEYNKEMQLTKKTLQGEEDYMEMTTYSYANNRLQKINIDLAGDIQFLKELFYNSKGELYLIKSTETSSNGKKNFATEAYSKGKLLFHRDHDGSNTFIYHKEPKLELQFLVKGKKTLAYLELLEDGLTEKNQIVESDLGLFIFDNIKNEKEIKTYNITVFKRNENQDVIASGSRENVLKPLQRIDFQKIEYADGTTSGSEDFNIFIYNELNTMK